MSELKHSRQISIGDSIIIPPIVGVCATKDRSDSRIDGYDPSIEFHYVTRNILRKDTGFSEIAVASLLESRSKSARQLRRMGDESRGHTLQKQ